MKSVMYKGYLIESYPETRLVGGPYENNEERQYDETGRILYKATPTKNNLPDIWFRDDCVSVKIVKTLINNKLNKSRTKKLETEHRRELKKFLQLKQKIQQLERELSRVGGKYEKPNWSHSYVY